MNQLQQFLSYNPQGIQRLRSIFIKKQALPKLLQTSKQLIQFFKQSKSLNPIGESSTSKYNISVLIEWIIDDIGEYNAGVFSFQPSCLNIVFCVLKMMQLNLIMKIFNTTEANLMSEQTRQVLQANIEENSTLYKKYCEKIRSNNCSVISQNHRKQMENLIQKRRQINFQRINPLQQLDIFSIFTNILLNLRRQIRKNWKQRRSEIKDYFKPLKSLQVKLYYLSIAIFPPSEKYLKELSNNIFSPQRSITYCHLIYDQEGLSKIFNYFEQAPFEQLQTDMDLISKTINRKPQNN